MTRLAFFSPLPPAPTGIADYTIDVLQALHGRYEIDVFHEQDDVDDARLPRGVGARRAETFEQTFIRFEGDRRRVGAGREGRRYPENFSVPLDSPVRERFGPSGSKMIARAIGGY